MGLKEALDTERRQAVKVRCSVCRIMPLLSKEDAADLQAALDDEMFPGASIARALVAEGYDIADQSVNRHRRGSCRGAKP